MESCKNCVYLKKVMCHPTNGEYPKDMPWLADRCRIGHGPINQQMAWLCTVPDMPEYMFLDKDTGMCECHTSIAEWRDMQIDSIIK